MANVPLLHEMATLVFHPQRLEYDSQDDDLWKMKNENVLRTSSVVATGWTTSNAGKRRRHKGMGGGGNQQHQQEKKKRKERKNVMPTGKTDTCGTRATSKAPSSISYHQNRACHLHPDRTQPVQGAEQSARAGLLVGIMPHQRHTSPPHEPTPVPSPRRGPTR